MTEQERQEFDEIVQQRLLGDEIARQRLTGNQTPFWQRVGQVAGTVLLGTSETTAIIVGSWKLALAGLIIALTTWAVTGLISKK